MINTNTKDIIYKDLPYPHLIIENFIKEYECKRLISEAKENMGEYRKLKEDTRTKMGGRLILPCTDDFFKSLLKKSQVWNDLHRTLNSIEMINLILKRSINNQTDKDTLSWILKKKIYIGSLPSLSKFISKKILSTWKRILAKKIYKATFKELIVAAFLNTFSDFYRLITFLLDYIFGRRRLSLLYDYSISKDGYAREIHRDSDARFIVFLLYLNDLDENVGGSLRMFKSKKKMKDYPFRPDNSSVEKYADFTPKKGKLIMFLNTSNAYHDVSLMKNSKNERHFIYGAYTLTHDLFSLARINSKSKSLTNFLLYREQ